MNLKIPPQAYVDETLKVMRRVTDAYLADAKIRLQDAADAISLPESLGAMVDRSEVFCVNSFNLDLAERPGPLSLCVEGSGRRVCLIEDRRESLPPGRYRIIVAIEKLP